MVDAERWAGPGAGPAGCARLALCARRCSSSPAASPPSSPWPPLITNGCLRDPEPNHPFSHPGQHPQHVERLAAYWAEVMGGPPRYSQTCGDQSGLLHMHAGNGDMSDLGRRFVDCFARAAADAGLPADPEFRAALRAYMEWAVADMLSYPSPDAAVPAGACRTGHGTASRLP